MQICSMIEVEDVGETLDEGWGESKFPGTLNHEL